MSEQLPYLKVRGFRLAQRKTSVSLEDAFWEATRTIAAERGTSIQNLIAEIDAARCGSRNLSSAIRIFVLEYYQGVAAEAASPHRRSTAFGPTGALARDTFNGTEAGSAPEAR